MFFTLIFNDMSMEGPTICVDLCFHPSPVWYIGEWQYVPGGGREPHYQCGYMHDLEVRDGGLLSRNVLGVRKDIKVTVVCHPQGHGTEDDLEKLLEDLKGYKEVELLRCSD